MLLLLRLVRNLALLLLWPFRALFHALRRPRAAWIGLVVRPRVVELETPRPFFLRHLPVPYEPPTELHRIRALVADAIADRRLEGVLLVVPRLACGWAECEGLRDAIAKLRAGGKKTCVYLSRGGGEKEIYVASAADRVMLAPPAPLALTGLGTESLYFAAALEKIGVRLERFHRSEYKTAYETFARDAMSDGQREQLEALLGDIQRALEAGLEAKLGSRERVATVFSEAFLSADRAKELGVVDDLAYEDEIPALLGLAKDVRPFPAGRYYAWHRFRAFLPLARKPYVAVVPIRGVIVEKGAPDRDLPAVQAALRRVGADPKAIAVVLYVDSPGGSALASDLIHRDVLALTAKKPVVAFFGGVAASGGYYVAAPASTIVARSLTVTGSIGVLAARPSIEGLLARLDIHREVVRTTEHADAMSAGRPLTEKERAMFEREIDAIYRGFVNVVATGRRKTYEDVEPLARGRVWTGRAAAERGLVDRLGGLDAAVDAALAEARERGVKVDRAEPAIVVMRAGHLPPPPTVPRTFLPSGWADGASDVVALLASGERAVLYDPRLHRAP